MKIYTRTGDEGQTSLVGGTRISKGHDKIEAYGSVDELNAWLGVLRDQDAASDLVEIIAEVQDKLFVIGSNLALEVDSKIDLPEIKEDDITFLEKKIDEWNESLPVMRNFVLPGGHQAVSFAHVCRVVCRRAERQTIRLSETESISPILIKYLNRLSDFLFILSRKLTQDTGAQEVLWRPKTD